MSRSGYTDYCDEDDDEIEVEKYRDKVAQEIESDRGQDFLKELAVAMDAMDEKLLIAGELIDEEGDCCAIGLICKARGIDVSRIDPEDPDQVANAVGIAEEMAREIAHENDDYWGYTSGTPEKRWKYMRRWVERHLIRN